MRTSGHPSQLTPNRSARARLGAAERKPSPPSLGDEPVAAILDPSSDVPQVAPFDPKSHSGRPGGSALLLKLLVPAPLCGIVIGAQGATIKGFVARSGANVRCVH